MRVSRISRPATMKPATTVSSAAATIGTICSATETTAAGVNARPTAAATITWPTGRVVTGTLTSCPSPLTSPASTIGPIIHGSGTFSHDMA
jgi:hypothetical protein